MRDKSSKALLAVIVALVIGIVGSAGIVLNLQSTDEKPKVSLRAPADQQTNFTYLRYQGEAGRTALELLKDEAEVVTKDSSYGPYVDSINGVKGGMDGKYWAFYVNGSLATQGADAYTTKAGDTIEWKFEQ
jgi:hypothetical protein